MSSKLAVRDRVLRGRQQLQEHAGIEPAESSGTHLVILPRLDLRTKGRIEHQHTQLQGGHHEAWWADAQR